jgi:hypothetical protein
MTCRHRRHRPASGPAALTNSVSHRRPGGRTSCTACAAQTMHRDVIGPSVDVDFAMVAARSAGNEQSAHAVLAHVAEPHRAD